MAFVCRSPKNSYFDQTAISSLRNDVTNLSNFLGQDESTLYTEDCIKKLEENRIKRSPIKGLTFSPDSKTHAQLNQQMKDVLLGVQSSPINLNKKAVKTNKNTKQHFPHGFHQKENRVYESKSLAEQIEEYIEYDRKRRIKKHYSIQKSLPKGLDKSYSNSLRRETEESNTLTINQINTIASGQQKLFPQKKLSKEVNQNLRKVLNEQNSINVFPSIPAKRNKFGYVLDPESKRYSLPSLVSEMKYTGNKQNMPGPCDYVIDAKQQTKCLARMSDNKHKISREISTCQDSLDLENQIAQQKTKKLRKIPRTQQQINSMKLFSKQEQDDSSDEGQSEGPEFMGGATPGPGYYQFNPTQKPEFRSQKQQFQNIFINRQPRFLKNEVSYQQITLVNDGPKQQTLKNQGFLFRSVRKLGATIDNYAPPPGHYNNRNTIEHIAIDKLLKGSNSKAFISKDKRFLKYDNPFMPGPGHYVLNNDKLQEQKDTLMSIFKTEAQRCLFPEKKDPSKPQLKQRKREIILHALKDGVLESKQPLKVPFLSAQARFKQRNPFQDSNVHLGSRIEQRVMKPSPPKLPFNSSAERTLQNLTGQGAPVGSYDIQSDHNWTKKSHNVLFN